MIAVLVPLLVVGLLIWIVRASRRAGPQEGGGPAAVRRLLQHAALLAALFAGASGVSRLLATALPAEVLARRDAADLALGLSLTIVAVPVWVGLWRHLARRLREQPEERDAAAWSLYLVVGVTVSLVVAFVNLVEAGGWVVGIESYHPAAVASALVWSAVWATQVRLLRHPELSPRSELPQAAVIIGSLLGLLALAIGAGGALRHLLEQGYLVVTGSGFVDGALSEGLRGSLVLVAVAVPVWWWHWLHQGVSEPRTTLWHGYVLLVAVLGGLLAAVSGAAWALHGVLHWFFGFPEATRAAVHFTVLPGALAAVIVGVGVWRYHRLVLDEAPERERSEPERAYDHLVAALGLVAAAAGATVAIMAAVQTLTPGALASADRGGRNALLVAITMLIIGLPVWGWTWRGLQLRVAAGAAGELAAPSRRTYLALLLGVAGLVAMVSLAVLLFVVLRDLLEGNLAVAVLHDVRAAIGLVLVAGAVAGYHWSVHVADRRARPEEAPHPRDVLLVTAADRDLAVAVAGSTGARVRRLHRLDVVPNGAATGVEQISAAILASPYPRVLVTVEEDGGVHVIPYDAS
jgi:hypothetical protein